jgi:hypothetical protein
VNEGTRNLIPSKGVIMTRTFLLVLLLAVPVRAADKPERPLRILLVTSHPGLREFHFLETFFVREMDKRRCDFCVHQQPKARVGNIVGLRRDRDLKQFPSRLREIDRTKPGDEFDNLAWYDLIVTIDLDVGQLKPDDLTRLDQWVRQQGGGLVFVAGPIQFGKLHALKGKERESAQPLLELLPVVPGPAEDRETVTRRRLHFPRAAREVSFLRLDKPDQPFSGWDRFFDEIQDEDGTANFPKQLPEEPERGFFDCHPLKGVKKEAKVLATFADPKRRLPDGNEIPYLATMKSGKGQVIYMGTNESWRMRTYRDEFHENFWRGLARYTTGR